jgi:hypothetical protein
MLLLNVLLRFMLLLLLRVVWWCSPGRVSRDAALQWPSSWRRLLLLLLLVAPLQCGRAGSGRSPAVARRRQRAAQDGVEQAGRHCLRASLCWWAAGVVQDNRAHRAHTQHAVSAPRTTPRHRSDCTQHSCRLRTRRHAPAHGHTRAHLVCVAHPALDCAELGHLAAGVHALQQRHCGRPALSDTVVRV